MIQKKRPKLIGACFISDLIFYFINFLFSQFVTRRNALLRTLGANCMKTDLGLGEIQWLFLKMIF